MDDLLLEDVDDDLIRQIEESARKHGITFSDEAIRLLEVGLAHRGQVGPDSKIGIPSQSLKRLHVRDFDGLDLKLVNPFETGA
jgi:hypothetical protein